VSAEQALARIEGVEGWLSEAQARRLHECAGRVQAPARIVEIGSFRGRSAIVFAHAATEGVEVVAIDPHAGNDRGPQQIQGTTAQGDSDHTAFRANLERAGVAERVRHVRLPSQEALGAVEGDVAVLYVDGAHRYRPARDDIVRWGARVADDGTLLIHDSFSSIGVTLAILRHLMFSGEFAYVGRTSSLAEYRRTRPRGRVRARSAVAQATQLPWFARNVLVKLALVVRLRPLARMLGHASGDWPY
jgi:predicted O-methyltransferase YrrM